MQETPTFWRFASGYLHEDWPVDYGSAEGALTAWMGEHPDEIADLRDELATVLNVLKNEVELDQFVASQGAAYIALPEDGGYRGWLTRVLATLNDAIA